MPQNDVAFGMANHAPTEADKNRAIDLSEKQSIIPK
jgi:hypothetical protein